MLLNAMNYETLQKVFFTHPSNMKFLLDSFKISTKSELLPITIFDLQDSSTVILFHDSNSIFISIFSESMLIKVDDILLSVFEKSYNDIFHTYKEGKVKNLVICMFSKDYIFNDTSTYVHQYNSTSDTRNSAIEGDNGDNNIKHPEEFSLFDDITINVIELKKAYFYSENEKEKAVSGIMIGENIVSSELSNINQILHIMDSSNWTNENLLKYYDSQSKSQKIVNTQKTAFHEGFKFGQHDGQINTAYFIKGLVSEKNPNLEEFLFNLCYVKNNTMVR
jgi:hypothetical protein